jgi:HEAT repeat protein
MIENDITACIDALRRYPTWDDYVADPDPLHEAETALIAAGEAAVPALIDALREPGWGMAAGAIYCLGAIGDVRAVQPLINALATDDLSLRSDIVEALLKLGNIVVRPLIFALTNADINVRRGAAFAVGLFKDELAVLPLSGVLTMDEAAPVRAAAADSLAICGDARAVDALIKGVQDSDPAVREASVRALGVVAAQFGVSRALPALSDAMKDPDWGTRQSASEMVIKLDSPDSPRVEAAHLLLVADLVNDDPEIRLGAAYSLKEVGDPRAADALTRLLYHWSGSISAAAALALGELGDERAIPALRNALSHADPQVRHAAQQALRNLGMAE